MESQEKEQTDDSPTLPVSSLRSRFENMLSVKNGAASRSTPSTSRQPSPRPPPPVDGTTWARSDGRFSLDVPRGASREASPHKNGHSAQVQTQPPADRPVLKPPGSQSPSKPRPLSMGQLSPPKSPPAVNVESPSPPPKHMYGRPITPLTLPDHHSRLSDTSRSASPASRQPPIPPPSRGPSPKRDVTSGSSPIPITKPTSSVLPPKPGKPSPSPMDRPPINRAAKPKMPENSPAPRQVSASLAAPPAGHESAAESISPFSTPPHSDPSSPEPERAATPPRIREDMKPRLHQPQPPPQPHIYTQPPPSNPVASQPRPRRQPEPPPSVANLPPPPNRTTKPPPTPAVINPVPITEPPPRRRSPVRHPPAAQSNTWRTPASDDTTDGPVRRSTDTGFRTDHLPDTSHLPPPPKRTGTMPVPYSEHEDAEARERPRPRTRQHASDVPGTSFQERNHYHAFEESDQDQQGHAASTSDKYAPRADYPDASQSNRRPPLLDKIYTNYDTKLFAVCGKYACTSGFITRAWDVVTGEVLMNMHHDDRGRAGEKVRMTSAAFKPHRDANREGERIWLGSNFGEILEVDIPNGVVVKAKAAHKRDIVRIYRHASNMWSLDESGKVLVWPPDADGTPNLSITASTFGVKPGHSFSVLTGNKLWLAVGRDLFVYQYDDQADSLTQVASGLSQPGVGDVTSGSTVASHTDRIYFGHVDGKVTVYSVNDFSCLGVLNVSVYKINTLVGVGDYLWAAYNTGYIRVYDPSEVPWRAKKEWLAHPDRIHGVAIDRTGLWKLDRQQVVSLGTDQTIKFWDGMLRDDWLENDMLSHDTEFCDFREVTALVMTWNAGASKPSWLLKDSEYAFRDILGAHSEHPDIVVFGFQELIDLEKKSTTAKNIFKLGKKKDKDVYADGAAQDHMSHQYRNWLEYLEREVGLSMGEPYVVLHTANLIGLFTCVFVKSSLRQQISDVNGAEVKVGMGGHYGNKGALIVRFTLDDSSLCFINCHLAAGQTQTSQRNNDIATIMEAHGLPAKRDGAAAEVFVGGGDGSMILDHEICILNGDLNYRIDAFTRDAVISHVRNDNLSKLLERDQLLQSRRKNPGFRLAAFAESPISFAPTYKYDVGTDNYDSSEKRRSPAWCDRLLYRGRGRVRQLEYRRHDSVRVSDHRPVTGLFEIRVKTVDQRRRKTVWAASEKRFEAEKRRIALNTKLDHLINVLGCSEQEAKQYLKK